MFTSQRIHNYFFIRNNSWLLSGIAVAALLVGSFSAAQAEDAIATTQNAAVSNSSSQTLVAADEMPAAPYSSSALPAAPVAKAQNVPYTPGAVPPEDRFHDFTFAVGAGFQAPAGGTAKWQEYGWGLQIAAGHNINRWLGAQLKYSYDWAGMPRWILNEENPHGGGDTHIWSFSFDPVLNLRSHGGGGLYVLGGPGFYRKVTEFTQSFCGPGYFGFYGACGSVVDAHWSNNAFGAEGGLGLTWRASHWNNMKYFAEARYVWIDNQYSKNNTATYGYPPANYTTGYFPVTFGVRW